MRKNLITKKNLVVLLVFVIVSALSIILIASNKSETTNSIENENFDGGNIKLDINTGSSFSEKINTFLFFGYTVTPQFAVWIEDINGNYIDTLYVTEKTANRKFSGAANGRKEALPYWSHKSGNEEFASGSKNAPKPDVVSGATPSSDMELILGLKEKVGEFRLMFEVNRSYDYNNFYAKDSNPNDLGYNTGFSGQPALVYSVVINTDNPQPNYILEPIGHSSPTGDDGELRENISNITTALFLLESIKARYEPAG